MLTPQEWKRLQVLEPGDFKYPDQMSLDVIQALDQFSYQVGARPIVLSDYRPGDLKQHGKGRAIDTVWPGQDPLRIWRAAFDVKLFSGIGVYLNEANVTSFHFDTRTGRSPEDPAKWGSFIMAGKNAYVGADLVLDAIKKKSWVVIPVLVALFYFLDRGTNN